MSARMGISLSRFRLAPRKSRDDLRCNACYGQLLLRIETLSPACEGAIGLYGEGEQAHTGMKATGWMAHMNRYEEGVGWRGWDGVWMSRFNSRSPALEAWRREYAILCRMGRQQMVFDTSA